MTPERWEKILRVFGAALELRGADRTEYLEAACEDDVELRREVEQLLRGHEDRSRFLSDDFSIPVATDPPSIEGYRLGERIGHGASGIVYRGTREADGKDVAIKVLGPGMSRSRSLLERFLREAVATRGLTHPGIVKVLDFGLRESSHYIVFELVEGRTLDAESARGPGPGIEATRRWVSIVAAIADALEHAHKHEILHRDIKPQNILVDADGKPRILDFGIARFGDRAPLTRSGELAGTPHYMSPEQVLAKRVPVDHRTDIFSLGIVLYELIAGHHPFEGTTPEILYRISFKTPTPLRTHWPACPPELERICNRAMEKDPARRYETAAAFADDLRRFLRGADVLAPKTPWRRQVARKLVTLPRGIKVAVVVGLVAGLMWIGSTALSNEIVLVVESDQEGVVYIQRITWLGIPIGEIRELGAAPVRTRIPPGYWRVWIEGPGGSAEVALFARAKDAPRIHLRPRPEDSGMVRIPGGEFIFGDPRHPDDEKNYYRQQTLRLPPFWIDKHEVTVGAYARFAQATGRALPDSMRGNVDPTLPVIGVSYDDAAAYARWVGKRLPSVAEWERANRGRNGLKYPWGDDATKVAQIAAWPQLPKSSKDFRRIWPDVLRPVNSSRVDVGPHGLVHGQGNAAEWTESPIVVWEQDRFVPRWSDAIVKGWALRHKPDWVGLYPRTPVERHVTFSIAGFRCAKSVPLKERKSNG